MQRTKVMCYSATFYEFIYVQGELKKKSLYWSARPAFGRAQSDHWALGRRHTCAWPNRVCYCSKGGSCFLKKKFFFFLFPSSWCSRRILYFIEQYMNFLDPNLKAILVMTFKDTILHTLVLQPLRVPIFHLVFIGNLLRLFYLFLNHRYFVFTVCADDWYSQEPHSVRDIRELSGRCAVAPTGRLCSLPGDFYRLCCL